MSQPLLTESPEKAKQRIERREPQPDPARSFHGGGNSLLQLQRTLGNQHVAQLIQARRVTPEGKIIGRQPKLTVGAADDQYEQEADRVARQVVSIPDSVATASPQRAPQVEGEAAQTHPLQSKPLPLAASITPFVQRQAAAEENKEEDKDKDKNEDEEQLLHARFLDKSAALPLQLQITTEEKEPEPIQAKLLIQRDISPQENEDKIQTKPLAGTPTPLMQRQTENDKEPKDEETPIQAKFLTEIYGALLQRQTASREEEAESIQTKSAVSLSDSFDAGDDVESRLSQSKGGGSPLPDPVRSYMEPRFGVDFSNVRIHTGSDSLQMNRAIGAQAFTHGSDIYYGAGSSPTNLELTAHELTHVVQQTGGAALSPQRTSVIQRDEQKEKDAPWWKIAAFGETIAWKMLNEFAPNLAPIVSKGPEGVFDWIKDRAADAASSVCNTLMTPVKTITGIGNKLSTYFTPLVATLQDAATKIAKNDCSPFQQAAEKIEKTAEQIITPIVETLQPVVAKIQDFLGAVWDKIGAPIWGWIQEYAGQRWQELKQLGTWIWKITEPMRSLGHEAWDWLKKKIGIGDGAEGENGIIQWIQAKLQSAWDWLKVKLAPFSKQLAVIKGVIAEVANVVSPEGPIHAIGTAVSQVKSGIGWIKDNLGKGDAIVRARVYVEKTLIPPLLGALQKMGSAVIGLAGSLSGALNNLAKSMGQAVGAASDSILSFAASAVQWIASQIDALAVWANQKLTGLAGAVQTAFGKLQEFLHGILEFLGKVGEAILDVWKLPLFVAGKIWNWIPACIRDPVVDFVIPIILRQIELFEELVRDNEAWQKTKTQVMKLIRQVFVDHDLMGALKGTFDLILRTFNIPPDMLAKVADKAAAAWDVVIKKPLDFIKNTVRSLGYGFKLLWEKLTSHLEYGIKGWLLGGIADKEIQFPADWTKPREVFGFVMDVLGLSVNHIFELLKKRLNPKVVAKAQDWISKFQRGWDWVTNMIDTSKSPAENSKGVMEKAKDFGKSILTGVVEWVAGKVAQELATLSAAAAASGGLSEVIDVARRVYKAMLSAKRWAGQILQMASETLDDVVDIASGKVQQAGAKFEGVMHKGMPVVIGFLADQVGLGGVGPALRNIVDKLREKVDEAVLWLIDKVKAGIEALLGAVGIGKKPDERTEQQKQADLDKGVADATALLENKELSSEQVKKKLPSIKSKYNMNVLELVTDAKSDTKETDHIHGAINPEKDSGKVEKDSGNLDTEQVKKDVVAEIQQLPHALESPEELSEALHAIFSRHQGRGLKKIDLNRTGEGFDILVEASAAKFATHLIGLTRDGAGGCSILIQIDGKIVVDPQDKNLALVVWNAGRGGPHAEARLYRYIDVIRSRLTRTSDLIEIWIRYSPCNDRCSFVLDHIEKEIKSTHGLARFKWYFEDLYLKHQTRDLAEEVVKKYNDRGIIITSRADAMKEEKIQASDKK